MPDGTLVSYTQPFTALEILPNDQIDKIRKDLRDVRQLGHGQYSLCFSSDRELGLMNKQVKYTSAERVVFRGEPVVLVKGTYVGQDIEHQCWIAPSKGHSVLRLAAVRVNEPSPDRQVCMSVDNEISLDEPSGIWFPSKVHVQVFDDGQLLNEHRAEVHTAEFNRPIPAAAFSLAGMDIDPGTPVYDSGRSRSLTWSGTTVTNQYAGPVPHDWQAQAVTFDSPTPGGGVRVADPTRTPRWVYLMAGGLAAIGLGLLALARRARR